LHGWNHARQDGLRGCGAGKRWVPSIDVSNRPISLVEAACFTGWLALPPTTWRIAGSTHNRAASLTSS